MRGRHAWDSADFLRYLGSWDVGFRPKAVGFCAPSWVSTVSTPNGLSDSANRFPSLSFRMQLNVDFSLKETKRGWAIFDLKTTSAVCSMERECTYLFSPLRNPIWMTQRAGRVWHSSFPVHFDFPPRLPAQDRPLCGLRTGPNIVCTFSFHKTNKIVGLCVVQMGLHGLNTYVRPLFP